MNNPNVQRVISALSEKPVPVWALKDAIRLKDSIAPILLSQLDREYEYALQKDSEGDAPNPTLTTCAFYLLAEMRDTRAFSRYLHLLTLPDPHNVFGDLLTEEAHSFLYSTYDGNLDAARTLFADSSVNTFARCAVLKCLLQLGKDGTVSRSDLVEFTRGVLLAPEEDPQNTFHVVSLVHIASAGYYELTDTARTLFLDGRAFDPLGTTFANFLDTLLSSNLIDPLPEIIRDSAKYLRHWKMVAKEEPADILSYNVGRNDPCPCGSGKKFKKCCLPKKEKLMYSKTASSQETNTGSRSTKAPPSLKTDFKFWDYPPLHRSGNRPGLADFFSDEAIDADRPVWEGMSLLQNSRNMFQSPSYRRKKREAALEQFWTAFQKFQAICRREKFSTPEDFDREYAVHYLHSREWLEALEQLLEEKQDVRLSEVQAVLSALPSTHPTKGDNHMEVSEILQHLSKVGVEPVPKEAVYEAIRQKDVIVPILLKKINELYERVQEDSYVWHEDPDFFIANFAFMLLGQIGDPRSFPVILHFFTLDHEYLRIVFGDALTEDTGCILYSNYNGDLKLLKAYIEDQDNDYYVRSFGVDVLLQLNNSGRLSRKDLCAYLRELLHNLDDTEEDYMFGGFVVNSLASARITEVADAVEEAFDDDMVFDGICTWDDYAEDAFLHRPPEFEAKPITDAMEFAAHWPGFDFF